MKSAYPKIFEPITIKRTTIKNRIAMTPMGTNYGETSGEMSNRHMNYYSLRAKGGVGLIILENANIEYPVGSNGTSQIRIDHDSFMPRYYQLVENLHKNGATVAIQINHAGASASSARTGMETVSSSNIPTKAGGETPRPMTKEEIMTTVKKYGEAAKRVQAIGFDAIEIPSLQYQIDSNFLPDGWRSYMARAVKNKFKKPVINAGNYRDPKVVEKVLESGDVDIVGMGRGLIAEPNWVKKVENGEENLLRKCISCNVGCAGNRIGFNRPIRCTVNPAVPEGDIYKALKVNKNCNVVVVGAGTAGMEAACTAAEVGCNVFVLEKNDHIGGLSTFISDLPSKTRMKDFPKYLEARAARLKNLYIFLNTEATVDKIKQFKPDIIVNSTGSVPLVPPIKGLKENIDAGNVNTIFGMINNVNAGKYPEEACQGKKVVVVGGGSVGLDVIEYFAPRGAECTIIDMLPQIGMLADPITKCSMRETHDKYGVKEYVNTALQEVKENAFTVKLPDGTIQDLEFDYGFNCLGMRSNNPILPELPEIQEAFADTHTYVYTIGDSVRARRIMEGTMEGRAILNVLESQGYLHLEPLE